MKKARTQMVRMSWGELGTLKGNDFYMLMYVIGFYSKQYLK
jgi:hypothetical protein